jgi:hypothetical protein
VFEVGAREFLVDDDASYMIVGDVPVVHRDDGRLEWLSAATVAADATITSRPNPEPTLQV